MYVIFESFFIQAIIRPEAYGIFHGMDIRCKNNLLAIARKMSSIFREMGNPVAEDLHGKDVSRWMRSPLSHVGVRETERLLSASHPGSRAG